MTNMEAYDRMLDRFEKSKKLEEVSGQDIDSLISLFERRKTAATVYSTTVDTCSNCLGKGIVPLRPGARGIRVCPVCNGGGKVTLVRFTS